MYKNLDFLTVRQPFVVSPIALIFPGTFFKSLKLVSVIVIGRFWDCYMYFPDGSLILTGNAFYTYPGRYCLYAVRVTGSFRIVLERWDW